MARLSKAELKLHKQAEDLVSSDKELSSNEVFFVLENWSPHYNQQVSETGAFFTPPDVASTFAVMTIGDPFGRIVDLCAGIGSLLYPLKMRANRFEWHPDVEEVVAIEYNPEYVRVGKRLFPEVTWVHGSIFDLDLLKSLGRFDVGISNPPFGKVPTMDGADWLSFNDVAHLAAVEVAHRICDQGACFILPQMDLPIIFSGRDDRPKEVAKRIGNKEWVKPKPYYLNQREDKLSSTYIKFRDTWPDLELFPLPVDLAYYKWDEAPLCEIVDIEDSINGSPGLPREKAKQTPLI